LRYAADVANESVTVDADADARGILLALLAMGDDESALACLDEKRRAVCAGAWRELQEAGETRREEILAQWRAAAASAVPQGLDRLHPSWIVAALEGEPSHIVRLALTTLPKSVRARVLGMLGNGDADGRNGDEIRACPMAIRREVAHEAFGSLAPLCESACGPSAEILCGLPFDELLTEAIRRGARAVGQSLAGAPPALRARAMAAAGEPWAQVIGAASAESTTPACRKAAMAHANTMIPDSARAPSERLLHIGLAALKSELVDEHAGSVYRVAGRLPAALGRPLIGW
jgi:hypothetical protein